MLAKFQPSKDTRHTSAPVQETMSRLRRRAMDSCSLLHIFTDKILPEGFDLDRFLTNSGIMINMVPHIVQHKRAGSYELVVATPCLDFLSEKFRNFQLVVGYDPFEPPRRIYVIMGFGRPREELETTRSTPLRKRPAIDEIMDRQNVIEKLFGRRKGLKRDIQVSYSHNYLPTYLLIMPKHRGIK